MNLAEYEYDILVKGNDSFVVALRLDGEFVPMLGLSLTHKSFDADVKQVLMENFGSEMNPDTPRTGITAESADIKLFTKLAGGVQAQLDDLNDYTLRPMKRELQLICDGSITSRFNLDKNDIDPDKMKSLFFLVRIDNVKHGRSKADFSTRKLRILDKCIHIVDGKSVIEPFTTDKILRTDIVKKPAVDKTKSKEDYHNSPLYKKALEAVEYANGIGLLPENYKQAHNQRVKEFEETEDMNTFVIVKPSEADKIPEDKEGVLFSRYVFRILSSTVIRDGFEWRTF